MKHRKYTLHMHNFVGMCEVSKLKKLIDGVAVAIKKQQAKEAAKAAAQAGKPAPQPVEAKPKRPRRITANSSAVIEVRSCCIYAMPIV